VAPDVLRRWVREAGAGDDIVAIYIATRPDCISDEYLAMLKAEADALGIDVCIELGLRV
jgi:radical SAM superfamily enzyme